MKTAITISKWTILITGLIEILLGLAFWTNNGLSLVPVHMLVGLILVITLWCWLCWRLARGQHGACGAGRCLGIDRSHPGGHADAIIARWSALGD